MTLDDKVGFRPKPIRFSRQGLTSPAHYTLIPVPETRITVETEVDGVVEAKEVVVPPFFITEFPITAEQYNGFVGSAANDGGFQGYSDSSCIATPSLRAIQSYLSWFGEGFRLPTANEFAAAVLGSHSALEGYAHSRDGHLGKFYRSPSGLIQAQRRRGAELVIGEHGNEPVALDQYAIANVSSRLVNSNFPDHEYRWNISFEGVEDTDKIGWNGFRAVMPYTGRIPVDIANKFNDNGVFSSHLQSYQPPVNLVQKVRRTPKGPPPGHHPFFGPPPAKKN